MTQANSVFIVPFLDATHSTFEIMIHRKLRRKEVYFKKNCVMFGDITGFIGVSGKICGTSAISIPGPLALRTITEMLGEEIKGGLAHKVVQDGVGELINMIAGQAKTTLGNTPYRVDITLPTIISGRGHELYHKQGTLCVSTIFETEDGQEFSVDICTSEI